MTLILTSMAFFEGGKVPSSLYTKFQNLQQKYITGDEILSEKENLQNYLNKEKEFYKILSDSKGEYPEIFSEKNIKRIDNLQWQIFKYESLLNNNSEDYYIHDIYKKDNIVKVFINTSNITLGLIPIIFFIIMFSDNYSREREDSSSKNSYRIFGRSACNIYCYRGCIFTWIGYRRYICL